MRVLICAATRIEANACGNGVRQSGGSATFSVLRTGIGANSASRALADYLDRHVRPDLIVSSGFAGGLSDDLRVGDWISSVEIFQESGERVPSPPIHPIEKAIKSLLVSVSQISPDAATRFAHLGAPLAVDMESAAIAEYAARAQIPFLALRLISDTPREPLPRFVATFTSSLIESSRPKKLGLWLQGAAQALQVPRQILRFLRAGGQSTVDLATGWTEFGKMLRILTVILAFFPVIHREARAVEPSLTLQKGSERHSFTRSELLARKSHTHVQIPHDPAYGNRPMAYDAVPLRELFRDFSISKDATIEFHCRDGFSAPMDRSRLLDPSPSIPYIAIENEPKWPPLKPNSDATAGPFYLIWTDPEKSGIAVEEWPFQLASFEVKPSLRTLYPQIGPNPALAPTDIVNRGFRIFAKNCFACHTINEQGPSRVGPDLNVPYNPTEYLGERFIRILVRDPQNLRHWPDARMPAFKQSAFPDPDLDAVIAYLKHMSGRKIRAR